MYCLKFVDLFILLIILYRWNMGYELLIEFCFIRCLRVVIVVCWRVGCIYEVIYIVISIKIRYLKEYEEIEWVIICVG